MAHGEQDWVCLYEFEVMMAREGQRGWAAATEYEGSVILAVSQHSVCHQKGGPSSLPIKVRASTATLAPVYRDF